MNHIVRSCWTCGFRHPREVSCHAAARARHREEWAVGAIMGLVLFALFWLAALLDTTPVIP